MPGFDEKATIYLRGEPIGALHAEYRERGIERLTEMEVRP